MFFQTLRQKIDNEYRDVVERRVIIGLDPKFYSNRNRTCDICLMIFQFPYVDLTCGFIVFWPYNLAVTKTRLDEEVSAKSCNW